MHSRSLDRCFFAFLSERRSIERQPTFRLQPARFRSFFPTLRAGLRGNVEENLVGFAGFGEPCGQLALVVQPPLATTVRVNHGWGAFTVKVVVHVPFLE